MADPTHPSDPANDPETRAEGDSTASTPLWVKVFGIIALVVIVLFVIMLIAGGHGPGRHTSAAGAVESHW